MAVVAHHLWADETERRKCFSLDNEGSKFSLTRGAFENDTVKLLCQFLTEQEVYISSLSWIARVPSYSSIADGPSRADVSKLAKLGFRDVSAENHISLASVCAILEVKMGEMAGHNFSPRSKRR